MTGKEMYRIWAPVGKKWVDWVRPVPFVEMQDYSKSYSFSNNTAQPMDFIDETCVNTAVIVDLPGSQSVEGGIELAKLGFRPIPIFNGTIEQAGARATVDNQSIGLALKWATKELEKLNIKDDALPAFLLDKNRLNRFKMEASLFDNSWDVYAQDLPSAEYLINNGISQVIVLGKNLSKDLKLIMKQYRKKNIKIFLTDGYEKKEYKRTIPR